MLSSQLRKFGGRGRDVVLAERGPVNFQDIRCYNFGIGSAQSRPPGHGGAGFRFCRALPVAVRVCDSRRPVGGRARS